MINRIIKKELGVNPEDIKWTNALLITLLHAVALPSLYTLIPLVRWQTYFWGIFIGMLGGFGVTAGAHRLWTHRSYKAKLPLKIILICCYSMAGQNSMYHWVQDHRVHHKFSETDADPHNSKRGFFFAHVGWLMQQKHPEVLRRGKMINMEDVLKDPVVQFHQKYFWQMKMLFCFLLPTIVPPLAWNEGWFYSFLSMSFIRYAIGLNFTWLVNSAAHIWGNKPYDRNISPVENRLVAFIAMGEGWHNYHHCFPWDYRAAELGNFGGYTLNITTLMLDFFTCIGWAYDCKVPDPELVKKVAENRGDGTHSVWNRKAKQETSEGRELIAAAIEVWDTDPIKESPSLHKDDQN